MKTLIIIVVIILVVFFMFKQKTQVATQVQEKRNAAPRCKPVYIDQPAVYLDEPIKYTEWDQKISSSL